ncbi:MAG TPA: sialidase family protein [Chthonomonadaceae bacterium]|nr:sialidase family protein [Chthonomonadaceae bacterium]
MHLFMSSGIPPSLSERVRRTFSGTLRTAATTVLGLFLGAAALAAPPPIHPKAQRVEPIPGTMPSVPQPSVSPLAATNPWVDLGPAPLNAGVSWSGRIAGIAADPTNANTLFVATAGGGVWKSTDGGTTYTPLTDNQATLAMGAIAIAPSNHNVIYAGTGEANNSGDSAYGYGVLKSTDGGSTWTLQGSSVFTMATISKIAISPTDPNTVYVAVNRPGLPAGNYAYSGQTGIWKTTDGGSTWTNTTTSLSTSLGYSDVALDANSGTLYAAIGPYYANSLNGVYRSTNGGSTWSAAGNFPMGGNNGRISIALFPSTSTTKATLYAAIESVQTSGLLALEKSTDGGTTWTALTNTPNYMGVSPYGQGWYNNAIAVSPSNANVVFAGGSSNGGGPNLIESTDGGATWTDISSDGSGNSPHTDEHALAFDANGKLLSGSDGGIWRLNNSNPSSLSWQDINGDLETIQFTGISLHPTNSNIAYGGSQDNGTEGTTGNLGWTLLIGGDGGHTRVDLANPTTIYQTFTGPDIDRSDNSGSSFFSITSGINFADNSNFYVPYVMDPANTSRLLLGTTTLYETTNKGNSWIGKGSFAATGPIDAIGVNGNTIYVAAGGTYAASSVLFVTVNDGTSWTNVTPAGITAHIADIAVDPTNAQHAFAVADHFGAAHVLATANGGSSWSDISGNLPNLPVNAVKYDHTASTIYIGTDMGVYASSGSGAWTQVGIGLPNARVVDLDLNTGLGLLGAGTHGRSMWEVSIQAAQTPVLSSLSPSSLDAGGSSFTLTAKGSSFVSGATIDWNGTPLTTTFVSSTQLKAAVPSTDIASPGTAKITVVNPGGATSASKNFKILVTTLRLTSYNVTRNSTTGVYTATFTLKNVGYLTAPGTEITKSTLGAAATSTTLPVTLGNIAAGATATATLTYPSSAGTPGTVVTLKVSGKFTGGTFSVSQKLTLP